MTGKPAPPPPSKDASLAGRMERLVNNEQFADVAFRVGVAETGEVIFGHKAILTEASEVFRAQFAGLFRESRENVRDHEVPVVDIEPASFKELLRYMYSERVTLTKENVVDISYGAKKYLLTDLSKVCEDFLQGNVTEENVLKVFDSNRRYELEEVNRKCLDIICDNPIAVFANESFLTLTRKSLELIASRQSMNCQRDQLLTAIEQWLQVNEDESEDGTKILAMVREQKDRSLMCKKMHNFSAGHYIDSTGLLQAPRPSSGSCQTTPPPRPSPFGSPAPALSPLASLIGSSAVSSTKSTNSPTNKTFTLDIVPDKPFAIYGVGIYIKSKQFQQTVVLDIAVEKKALFETNRSITTKRTVTAKEDICVEEILFEKQSIASGETCTITVNMHHGITPLFCLKSFEPEQPDVGLSFTCSNNADPWGCAGTNSCVAYVLYNTGTGTTVKKKDGRRVVVKVARRTSSGPEP